MAELSPGSRLGRYTVDRLVGRGAVADVFLAHDEQLAGRQVALKVFRDGGEQLRQRAALALRLEHPNIARSYGLFQYEDGFYLVQEWVAGGSLEAMLDRTGPLDVAETLRLGRDVASALGYAHARGILHRDLTPSNVLRQPHRGYQLVDFGALGVLEESTGLTRSGQVAGTPYYMSPEQITGQQQGVESDIFGLGMLLYRSLYGRLPDEAENMLDLLYRRVQEPIHVPESPLQGLIAACLALDPRERPGSATEVLDLISTLAEQWETSYTAPAEAAERTEPVTPAQGTLTQSPGQWQSIPSTLPTGSDSYVTAQRVRPRMVRLALAGVLLAAVVVVVVVAGASWTGIALVANGLIVAAVAIGVARWLRRRWSVASPQLERDASRLLFSAVGRAELSRSLMIEVDTMLEGLRSVDERILGMTVVAMLAEYDTADSSADRQAALLNMVAVLEKVEGRLAPWHVRHRDAIATTIAVVGCVAGVLSAVQPFLG